MMTVVTVTTEGSPDFHAQVVQPLRPRYRQMRCLTLQEAIAWVRSDQNQCDLVVIELASAPPAEVWQRWTGFSFFTDQPQPSAGELAKFLTHIDLAAVIVCCGPAVGADLYADLQDAGVHAVPLQGFDCTLLEELWILRRAGLPTRQVDAYFHLNRRGGTYPVPHGNLKALLALELPDPFAQAWLIREACHSVGHYEAALCLEVLLLMRASRWLASLEYEGAPYCLTFVLGAALPAVPTCILRVSQEVSIDLQARAQPALEDVTQLAQGLGTYLGVEAATGRITGIYAFPTPPSPPEKLTYFPLFAAEVRGMIFHVPGNKTVEVYTARGLRLQYDGFAWQRTPLAEVELALGKAHVEIDFNPRRLIHAIEQLAFRRRSSIIAIDPQNFQHRAHPVALEDLRPPGRLPPQPVSELSVEVLVSLLQLDGVHLVERSGRLYKVAQHVRSVGGEGAAPSPLGTGRLAAKTLSSAFPSAVVVKISASGGRITVFQAGLVVPP